MRVGVRWRRVSGSVSSRSGVSWRSVDSVPPRTRGGGLACPPPRIANSYGAARTRSDGPVNPGGPTGQPAISRSWTWDLVGRSALYTARPPQRVHVVFVVVAADHSLHCLVLDKSAHLLMEQAGSNWDWPGHKNGDTSVLLLK